MTFEAIGALSALGTLVVIAATAVAALVQLRHLRRSNQLSGLLSVLKLFQDPHFHELIDFVRSELPERMNDPGFVAGLEATPVDRKRHPELHVAEMYEEIGAYVRCDLIDEDFFLQAHWYNVLLYWKLLLPSISIVRKHRPYTWENFEYLAYRAKAWSDRHPLGNYPSTAPRMTGDPL